MSALSLAAEMAKPFEGLRLSPYHDPVGYPTIGYGHLLSREAWAPLSKWQPISLEEAEELLKQDMAKAAASVARLCPVEMADECRAALIDFTYNVGAGNLQASTLRRLVLRGEMEEAADQFLRWVFARGVKLPGLVRRRRANKELFLRGCNDRL